MGQVVAREVSLKTALLLESDRRSEVGPHSALPPPSWIRGFFLDPHVCWRRSKSPRGPSPGFGSGAPPRSDAAAQGRQSPLAGIGASLHPGIASRAIRRGESTLRGGWAAAGLEGQRDPQRESGVHHRAGARAPPAGHGSPVLRHCRLRLPLLPGQPLLFLLPRTSVLPREDLTRLSPPLPPSPVARRPRLALRQTSVPSAHLRLFPPIFGSFRAASPPPASSRSSVPVGSVGLPPPGVGFLRFRCHSSGVSASPRPTGLW